MRVASEMEDPVADQLTAPSARELPSSASAPAPSAARAGRPSRGAAFWKWTKRISLVCFSLACVAVAGFILVIRHYEADLPTIPDLKGNYHPPQVTRVLARDGTLLAELFTERRTVVSIQSLPPHVKLAVLAAEDANFYEHEGVNYLGIARAMVVNLRAGHTRQGGSTITQQVVKNILLDPERTYGRKIKEALLARELEQELTKDEILELYLNHIYFGGGRYGIQEAARYNFGKDAKDLTIAEAAMLAGVVAGPELYSPHKDIKKALMRRAYVLDQMHQKGFLNDAQYDAAKDEPVRLAPPVEPSSELAPEAVEIARKMLHDLEPDRSRLGGFTITTTIDPKLQAAARKAVRDNLADYDKRHGLEGPPKLPASAGKGRGPAPPKDLFEGTPDFEHHKIYMGQVVAADDASGTVDVAVGTALGTLKLADFERYNPAKLPPSSFATVGAHVRVSLLAPLVETDASAGQPVSKVPLRLESGPESSLVALDVRTRQIVALVGAYEADAGDLDRAMQARRQPGSTFKPILYSYALHARRYTPATLVDPRPSVFEGNYKPTNYEGYQGADLLRLRDALAKSVNVVAVRVMRDVGPSNVVPWAEALGIGSTMKPDLSLALGSYEVKPIELAGAYATFASGGVYEEPRIVTRIVGPDGKDVPLPPLPPPRRVLDDAEAYVTTSMLTSVVEPGGTGAAAASLRRPVAGKTGTSNASKDTWFAGYSTDLAAVVWVGYDDGKPLGGKEAGAVTALPAWIAFMRAAHEGKPPTEFPRPAGVSTVVIDRTTGMLPYDGDTDTMPEVFLAGTEPSETAATPEPDAGAAQGAGAAGDAGVAIRVDP